MVTTRTESDAATTGAGEGASLATVFIGIGANLGDASATLRRALAALRDLAFADRPSVASGSAPDPDPDPDPRFSASAIYRSAPVDSSGPDYLNAVARLRISLSPLALLDALQAIEQRFGRERPYRNAPRTLDLDLLLYGVEGGQGGLQYADARLELPHPRAAQRAFVLEPLAELWPDGEIPGAGLVADALALVRRDARQRIERLPG